MIRGLSLVFCWTFPSTKYESSRNQTGLKLIDRYLVLIRDKKFSLYEDNECVTSKTQCPRGKLHFIAVAKSRKQLYEKSCLIVKSFWS